MSRSIPRALGLAVPLLVLVASVASGSEYRALLDLDADPATGCSVSTAEGPFPGVERIVMSQVVGDEVIGVERRECVDPVAGTFGPPSAETMYPAPWPVGLGLGVGGTDLVETYTALPSCQTVRIGFESDDGLGVTDAILTADGSPTGAAIIVDCLESLEEIPTLTPWLLLLLSALVAGAGWLVLRRAPRAGRAALVVFLAMTVTGVAWAMILLDGSPTDWQALTSPARADASDPVGDAASSADLQAAFAFGDRAAGALFLRFDGTRNMVPAADPQDVTTDEDVAVLITLTATDPEGDALTFALDTSPEFGALSAILPTGAASAEVTYSPNPDVSGPDAFTFTVNDGATTSAPATVAIDVASINDLPMLGGGPFAAAFSENGAPVAVAPSLTVIDVDDASLASATVEITNLVDAGEEILAATPSGAIGAGDIAWVEPVLTIAPAGGASLADFESVLRSVTYENRSEMPSVSPARELKFVIDDGTDPSEPANSTVSVSATNDPPAIGGGPFAAAFVEELSGPVLVASTATLTDPDDTDLESLTVTITNLADSGEEILTATPSGAIGAGDIAWVAPVLTLAPAGGAPLADFEAVLRSATYEHTGEAPSEAPDRTLDLLIFDGSDPSAVATSTVTVAGTNDPPTLSTPVDVSFEEDAGPVAVAAAIAADDTDDANLAAATVEITNLADSGEEFLAATPAGAIGAGDIAWVEPVLTIAPVGGASLADFESVLRSVTYENRSDTPSVSPARELKFVIDDGTDPSEPANSTVSVSATNDPPAIGGGPFAAAFVEELSGPVLVASTATLTDPDDTGLERLTVTITNLADSGEEILTATPAGAIGAGDIAWVAPVLTLAPAGGASLADFEAVLRSATYEHTGEAPSEAPDRTLELLIFDGSDPSAVATSTVTVAGTNDPPNLSTPADVSFEEDAGPVAVAAAIAADDIDDANLAAATVEISNLTDSGEELLGAAPSGAIGAGDIAWVEPVLTIAPAGGASLADFESVLRSVTYENSSDTPSVSPARELTFVIDDGTDPSAAVTSTVRVSSTNDPPEIGGGPFAAAFFEELSGPVLVASNATLADPDDTEFTSLSVTITNLTDAGEEVLAATPSGAIGVGNITWVAPVLTILGPGGAPMADFEAVLRSVTYEHLGDAPSETPDRTLSMVVHDGSDPSDPALSTVTVTGTNDPPTLSTPSGAAFVEDAGPVAVAPALAVGDVDDDELGAATVSLTNAQDGALERLDAIACGGLAVSGSGTASLSINGVATRSVYEACLRSVTYENLSQAPTEAPGRSIELQVVDDGGSSSALVTSTVVVTGVNDPPTLGPSQSLVSLEDEVLPITVSGSDPEGDPLAIVVESIVLSAAGAGSVFSDEPGSGALAAGNTTTDLDVFFTPASNVFGNDLAILIYRLTDGTALSAGSATVTLDLTAVDDPVYATLPSELHGRQDGVINFILGGTSPEPDVWTTRIVQIPSFNGTLYLIVSPTERIPIDSPGSTLLPGDSSTTQWPMQFVPIPGTCNSDPTEPYNSFSYRFFHDGPPSLEYEMGFYIACPTGLLTISDASVVEGDMGTTDLTFTVTLAGDVAGGFNVGYSTVEGTATEGDYVPAAGTLSFAGTDGESKTITVTVNSDGDPEEHETFSIELAFPDNEDAGWAGSDNTGIGTILNDD